MTAGQAARDALEATFRRTYALHPNDFRTKFEQARDAVLGAADAYAQAVAQADLLSSLRTVLLDLRTNPTEARIQALHLLDAAASPPAAQQPKPAPGGWHVVNNVTGRSVSRVFDTEARANATCRTMNLDAGPGGLYGVEPVPAPVSKPAPERFAAEVRRGPCGVAGHEGEHFQWHAGDWVCGHVLAASLALAGIIPPQPVGTAQQPAPGDLPKGHFEHLQAIGVNANLRAQINKLRTALVELADKAEAAQAITEDEADEYRRVIARGKPEQCSASPETEDV